MMFEFIDPPATMDVHTKPGTKVIFKYPENGRTHDGAWAKLHLLEGGTYTVEGINVGQSSSSVEFKEFPSTHFNTVHFANIDMEES